jgi:WD40 repeat protein
LGVGMTVAENGQSQQLAKTLPLPAIAPNLARLDQTIHHLEGMGFAVAYHEEAGVLAAACEKNAIQLWHKDVLMGVRVGEGTPHVLKGHSGPVIALAWNGPLLASASADRKVILWNMGDQQIAHSISSETLIRALAMAPGGKWLATAGDDPIIQLWDTTTAKPGIRFQGHTDWVLCLDFSSDGKWLASGGHDGVVRIWDVAHGNKLLDIPARPAPPANMPPATPSTVTALAFSPDNKLLAIGTVDNQIHLANATDGKLARSLPGHTSAVTSLAFHPSGTVLASGSKDNSIRLWNPANGQAIKTLEGHTAWVQGVTFLAQGTRMASVGADHTVRLWDLTPQK